MSLRPSVLLLNTVLHLPMYEELHSVFWLLFGRTRCFMIIFHHSWGNLKTLRTGHTIGLRLLNFLTAVDGRQLLGPALWSVTDGPNLTFSRSGMGHRAGDWKHPLGVMAVSWAGDTRNTACQSQTLCAIKKRPQWHARHVTHAPGRLRGASWDSRTPAVNNLTKQERSRNLKLKTFLFLKILTCLYVLAAQKAAAIWDYCAVDSASWILSKIQQDICSIDRQSLETDKQIEEVWILLFMHMCTVTGTV